MNIAEKLTAIAENEQRVYTAGQSSMVDESKLIPKTVSGRYIFVDDVSEIPHTIETKLTSESLTDFSGVRVTRCGKNLFDISQFLTATGWKEENGSYVGAPHNLYTKFGPSSGGLFSCAFAENQSYTISYSGRVIGTTAGYTIRFGVRYTDNTVVYGDYISSLENKTYSFTSDASKTVSIIFVHYAEGTTTAIDSFQIECGASATEHEPYCGEVFTPNADGTVDEITSISPYMNIFTDTEGVNIEVEYNKSWGMQTERTRFYNDFQQGKINSSISFEWLTLDKAGITGIINALSGDVTQQTLMLKKTSKEAAFTDAEWTELIGRKSNWTILLV